MYAAHPCRMSLNPPQVKPEWLRPVPLHTPTVVEGFQLTFTDANHCPGAAVVTIRPAGRPRPLVVHTGDFRAGAELLGARRERAVGRACSTLSVLPTTTVANPCLPTKTPPRSPPRDVDVLRL